MDNGVFQSAVLNSSADSSGDEFNLKCCFLQLTLLARFGLQQQLQPTSHTRALITHQLPEG